MGASKATLQKIGQDYIETLEQGLGFKLVSNSRGRSFEFERLLEAITSFYKRWANTPNLLGSLDFSIKPWNGTNSAIFDDIQSKIRDQLAEKNKPGIYLIMNIDKLEDIRSLLMFADAIFFWDPFEKVFAKYDDHKKVDAGNVEDYLSRLVNVRDLVYEGLLVPAQIGCSIATRTNPGISFLSLEFPLLAQGSLGIPEFNHRLIAQAGRDSFALSVDLAEVQGRMGAAENKLASLLMPDVAFPVMNADLFDDYMDFCKKLESLPTQREAKYRKLAWDYQSGFVLDGAKLTNQKLIQIHREDLVFEAFREGIVSAIESFENSSLDGFSADFATEFNIEINEQFRKLKAAGATSNVWKDYVDESKTLSKKIIVKASEHIYKPVTAMHDVFDSLKDMGSMSVVNIAFSALKTYSRYRRTKLFIETAAAIRSNHKKSGG